MFKNGFLCVFFITFVLLLGGCRAERRAEKAAAPRAETQPSVRGTRLTDAQLFDAFDLTHQGLEKVKSSVESGDLSAARRELAYYLRGRKGKFWRFDPHKPDRNIPYNKQTVEDIVKGTGYYRAFSYRLPNGEIDWSKHEQWTTPRSRAFVPRMYWWTELGKAYWATGDERYAKAWVEQLRSWIRQYPAPVDPKNHFVNFYWTTLVTGIRLRSSWTDPYNYFLHSPSFTDDDIILYLKSTIEQTRFIRLRHRPSGNWLTFSIVGLYSSGILFPELKEAADWRDYAVKIASRELKQQFLPDGVQFELSPTYHNCAISNLVRVYKYAKDVGRDDELPKDFTRHSEKAYDFMVYLMSPDGYMPQFNDSAPCPSEEWIKNGAELFPHRLDFQWVASGGKEGAPPAETSHAFPYAGYFVMRSGWDEDANYLCFDAGPVGYRHAHQDKLNVVLYAFGREMLYDGGGGDYDESAWRRYAMDTFSHNTVLVDGRPQRRDWNSPNPRKLPYKPLTDTRWKTTKMYDFAAGTYDEHYGQPSDSDPYPYGNPSFYKGWCKPAKHIRRVLFVKPDLFIIADTLTPNDEAEHTYQARWHLNTTATKLGKTTLAVVTTDKAKPNLVIVPLLTDGLKVLAVSAQTEPEILGWRVEHNDKRIPTTTVLHTLKGAGVRNFLTLLLPLKAGETNPVRKVLSTGITSVKVILDDGRRLLIVADADPAGGITFTEILSDGATRERYINSAE